MRGRLMRAPIAFVAIVGVAATLLSPAGARPEASRIVDRTFLCESGFLGGLFGTRAGKAITYLSVTGTEHARLLHGAHVRGGLIRK